MLVSETHWIWDSWIADDGEHHHLFYLQAPRSLRDPGLRHLAATVGHARSRDLVTWEVLPDALGPTPGSWDDLSIWTGSTVRGDDGTWRMFYTATSSRGYGVRDQRIGLAESDDLVTWRKVGSEPLLTADPRWYKTLPEDVTASETWRDPQVFRDPDGDGWHMLVTARARTHGQNDDGVLAHARSSDLRTWEVGPPVCEPGHGFGQLEVAQVVQVDGRWVMVFTCHPQEMTAERRSRTGDHCTWSVPGTGVDRLPQHRAGRRPLLRDHRPDPGRARRPRHPPGTGPARVARTRPPPDGTSPRDDGRPGGSGRTGHSDRRSPDSVSNTWTCCGSVVT